MTDKKPPNSGNYIWQSAMVGAACIILVILDIVIMQTRILMVVFGIFAVLSLLGVVYHIRKFKQNPRPKH